MAASASTGSPDRSRSMSRRMAAVSTVLIRRFPPPHPGPTAEEADPGHGIAPVGACGADPAGRYPPGSHPGRLRRLRSGDSSEVSCPSAGTLAGQHLETSTLAGDVARQVGQVVPGELAALAKEHRAGARDPDDILPFGLAQDREIPR